MTGGKVLSCSNMLTLKKKWPNIRPVSIGTSTNHSLTCTSTIANGFSWHVWLSINGSSISTSVLARTSLSGDLVLKQNSHAKQQSPLVPNYTLQVERWMLTHGRDCIMRPRWICRTTWWSASNITIRPGPMNWCQIVQKLALSEDKHTQRNVWTSTWWIGTFRVQIFSSLNSKRSLSMRKTNCSLKE